MGRLMMIAMLLAVAVSGYAQRDSLTVIETGDSIGRMLAPMDSVVAEDTKALLADSTSVVVKKQRKEKVKRDWLSKSSVRRKSSVTGTHGHPTRSVPCGWHWLFQVLVRYTTGNTGSCPSSTVVSWVASTP